MTHTANIMEIFSSLQGEGPHTGTPMTFVRFSSCNLGCKWCDTTAAAKLHETCRVESPPRCATFIEVPNPITVTKLCGILERFENEYISVTGGEPLIQSTFLSEWLPTAALKHLILLETSGINFRALADVLPYVHIISMDLKLPSSTGLRPLWTEHEAFLRMALKNHKEVYIKIIVTAKTSDHDLQEAIRLISKINRFVPVILQPASPTLTFYETIDDNRLNSLSRIFSAYLPNVSVKPQMHKDWGIL